MAWPRISNAWPAWGEILRRRATPAVITAGGNPHVASKPPVVVKAAILSILTRFFDVGDAIREITEVIVPKQNTSIMSYGKGKDSDGAHQGSVKNSAQSL